MIFVLHGQDALLLNEHRNSLLKKYREDDYNFQVFEGQVEIADFTSALSQVPMIAEYFVVHAVLNKKQLIRLKPYLKPSEFTILIIELTDAYFKQDLIGDVEVDKVYDCSTLKGKALLKWIADTAKSNSVSLDKEEQKLLASSFSELKEIEDVIFQLSCLSPFDQKLYLKDIFGVKQKFVWELYLSFILGKKKDFFRKYTEQLSQNMGLSKSQFNMKLLGGLIYCCNNFNFCPEWLSSGIPEEVNMNRKKINSFVFLMEVLALSKRESDSVLILDFLSKSMDKLKLI